MSKYMGCATDESWYKAVFQCEDYGALVHRDIARTKLDEGMDMIFSVGRFPRVYGDEITLAKVNKGVYNES